jgi:L-alanine-DL-glutamate epimerase-like enolase superfamily enzyme
MKITRIDTIPVQIPIHPHRAIRGGRGAHTTSPFLLIKIQTDAGITGLGEVCLLNTTPSPRDTR